jgi:hypothetical protein
MLESTIQRQKRTTSEIPANPWRRVWDNIFWYVLGSAVLGSAFLFRAPYIAYACYAFLLLLLIAHYSSLAWVSGLDCERTVSETTVRQGDEIDVQVTVANRRGFPIPWIFIEDLTPPGFPRIGENTQLAVLMPGQVLTLNYRLQCPQRGYHRIGPLVLESGDVFGLQKRFRTGERQDYISVLPTVAYIETFNISARRPQGPVRISNRIYEDPTRINSIREYSPGDPLNKIHWKASARMGKLFVKQNDPSNVLGGTLILDLHDESYGEEKRESRTELAITTTASIGYLLQMSGEQVGMLTNALDAAELAKYDVDSAQSLERSDAYLSVVGEGESDRISPLEVPTMRTTIQALKIIENLARVVPGKGLHIEDLIMSSYRKLPRDAALLPVVPYVSPRLAEVLAEMKLSGFAVSVFFIDDRKGYMEAASLLAPHNINVFHIEHERNLHELSPDKIGR